MKIVILIVLVELLHKCCFKKKERNKVVNYYVLMNIGTFYTTCKCQLKCHNHDVCKVVYILCGQILYNAIDDEQLFHTVSRETTCTGKCKM